MQSLLQKVQCWNYSLKSQAQEGCTLSSISWYLMSFLTVMPPEQPAPLVGLDTAIIASFIHSPKSIKPFWQCIDFEKDQEGFFKLLKCASTLDAKVQPVWWQAQFTCLVMLVSMEGSDNRCHGCSGNSCLPWKTWEDFLNGEAHQTLSGKRTEYR